jgi:hypothetical protein
VDEEDSRVDLGDQEEEEYLGAEGEGSQRRGNAITASYRDILLEDCPKPSKCYECQEFGHKAYDCPKKKEGFEKPQGHQRKEGASYCVEALENCNVEQMEEKNRGEVNLANKKKSTWIVDSGCTQHMCNDKSLFTTLGDLKEPKNMLMGNGDVLEVTQEGNVGLRVPTNQGVVHGTFREVLYTPEIRRNLVSVTKLMRQKISTVFHEETNKCYLVRGKVWFDPRDVVGYAHPNNDLWVMDEKGSSGESGESYSAEQSAEEKLWHLRLGHLGNDNLKKMLSKEMVRGFKPMVRFEGTHPVCEGCMKGRQSREAFPVC